MRQCLDVSKTSMNRNCEIQNESERCFTSGCLVCFDPCSVVGGKLTRSLVRLLCRDVEGQLFVTLFFFIREES